MTTRSAFGSFLLALTLAAFSNGCATPVEEIEEVEGATGGGGPEETFAPLKDLIPTIAAVQFSDGTVFADAKTVSAIFEAAGLRVAKLEKSTTRCLTMQSRDLTLLRRDGKPAATVALCDTLTGGYVTIGTDKWALNATKLNADKLLTLKASTRTMGDFLFGANHATVLENDTDRVVEGVAAVRNMLEFVSVGSIPSRRTTDGVKGRGDIIITLKRDTSALGQIQIFKSNGAYSEVWFFEDGIKKTYGAVTFESISLNRAFPLR